MFEEALAIARKLTDQLGTPESRRCVSESLNRLGSVLDAMDELDLALEAKREELAIDEADDLEQTLPGAIALATKAGDPEQAERWQRRLDELI